MNKSSEPESLDSKGDKKLLVDIDDDATDDLIAAASRTPYE